MKQPFAILALLALVLACGNKTGTGSRSGPAISGTFFMPGGTIPATGATVKLFNVADTGLEPVSMVFARQDGSFSFEDIDTGIYRLWVQKDSFVRSADSLIVTSEILALGTDTLETPSSLSGIVALEPQHEPTSVSIRVVGTGMSFDVPANDGRFSLTGLSGGTAHLLLTSTIPDYLPTVTAVSISRSSQTTLDDTLRLTNTGIPVVSGISLVMDTLAGTVKISWQPVSCGDFRDYVIYKDPCDVIGLLPEPSFSTKDTFIVDASWIHGVATRGDTIGPCCNYRVALRTIGGPIGLTNGYSRLRIVTKSYATTFFANRLICDGKYFDSISINDTVMFSVTAINRTRPLRKLTWLDHSSGKSFDGTVAADSTVKKLTDSIRICFPDTGRHYFYARVTDNAGKVWHDEMAVKVVIDTLAAQAGTDTGVFIGEQVVLHGSAFHRFGTIPSWRWKVGSGSWTASKKPDTIFSPPASEQTVLCSLAITDDDGKTCSDTVKFTTSFKALHVAAGAGHSLILKSDGGLWTCGNNTAGQLGDGTNLNRTIPVRIMSDVRSMAAGDLHTLIVTLDSTLWVCGDNSRGQFGDGTTEGSLLPKPLMQGVFRIAAGGTFSLVLKNDGTLWVCGWNPPIVPADSVANFNMLPVHLLSSVKGMAAGKSHILILKTDNTLWSCGQNTFGQLGDGSHDARFTPMQVMTDVAAISAGAAHSLLIKIDGSVWGCGGNSSGQLGDGSTQQSRGWKRILSDVQSISAGADFSLMLGSDGILRGCGSNNAGQLGESLRVYKSTPFPFLNNVGEVAAGASHSLLLKTDGSVWICGANEYGQLGISGSPATPVRVVPYCNHE